MNGFNHYSLCSEYYTNLVLIREVSDGTYYLNVMAKRGTSTETAGFEMEKLHMEVVLPISFF